MNGTAIEHAVRIVGLAVSNKCVINPWPYEDSATSVKLDSRAVVNSSPVMLNSLP